MHVIGQHIYLICVYKITCRHTLLLVLFPLVNKTVNFEKTEFRTSRPKLSLSHTKCAYIAYLHIGSTLAHTGLHNGTVNFTDTIYSHTIFAEALSKQ